MYTLRTFVSIGAFIDNTANVISPLGELSPISKTYSKDIAHLSSIAHPNVTLNVFNSDDDGTIIPIDTNVSDVIHDVTNWMYTTSIGGGFDNNSTTTQALIESQYTDITVHEIGSMVSKGTFYLPGFMEVEVTSLPDNRVKIWFSNGVFEGIGGYDLYEISVIPPVDIQDLDDLHLDNTTAQTLINDGSSPTRYMDLISVAAGNNPYTKLDYIPYTWNSKSDTTTITTVWGVVIWGNAGANADAIRTTIADYILNNSNEPLAEWELVYPDIFQPTEYYIIPMWDRFSIPDNQNESGLYSPVLPVSEIVNYTSYLSELPQVHIDTHLATVPTSYNGLNTLAIGADYNRDNLFKWADVWPEYIDISSSSPDFNRLNIQTQEFIFKFNEMLVVAEGWGQSQTLPVDMSIVVRNNNTFISHKYGDVVYMVLVK